MMDEGGDTTPHFEDWERQFAEMDVTSRPLPDAGFIHMDGDIPPAEAAPMNEPADAIEELAGSIRTEIRSAITAAYEDYKTAGDACTYQSPEALLTVSADMAEAAAAAGDVAEVNRHVDAYLGVSASLGDHDKEQRARLLYAGTTVGNEQAFGQLQALLDVEKEVYKSTLEHCVTGQQATAPAALQSALHAILRASDERDLPADAWKQHAAVDAYHAWEINADHLLMRVVDAEPGRSAEAQAALDRHIAGLTELEATEENDRFIARVVPDMFARTTDSALREQLVDRFKVAHDSRSVWLTTNTISRMVGLGVAVTEEPKLATPERVAYFEETIADILTQCGDEDVLDATAAAIVAAHWNMALSRLCNPATDPAAIISAIDAQIADITAAAADNTRHISVRDQVRDRFLGDFAQKAAQQGAYGDAAVYLNNVGSSQERRYYIEKLLRMAETVEQMQTMAERIDPLASQVDPYLQRLFDNERRLLRGSAPELLFRALDCTRSRNRPAFADGWASELRFIGDALDRIAQLDNSVNEEPEMSSTTQAVLASLRDEEHAPYGDWIAISRRLIATGDPYEPARAYRSISQQTSIPEVRIVRQWQLLQDIIKSKEGK